MFTSTPTDRGLINQEEQQELVKAFTDRLNKMDSKLKARKKRESEEFGSPTNKSNQNKEWDNDSLSIVEDKDEDDSYNRPSNAPRKGTQGSQLKINVIHEPGKAGESSASQFLSPQLPYNNMQKQGTGGSQKSGKLVK